jgi:hypothetical protein
MPNESVENECHSSVISPAHNHPVSNQRECERFGFGLGCLDKERVALEILLHLPNLTQLAPRPGEGAS